MFGRRRGRHARSRLGRNAAPAVPDRLTADHDPEPRSGDPEPRSGPFDADDAPVDEVARLDLGALRLPVPHSTQLQVEVDQAGPVRAVHLLAEHGQLTVNAFAAPRSTGLWDEVRREISDQLRADGARVSVSTGEWGPEIVAVRPDLVLRFIGVDGPRWLLRGVAAGPAVSADALAELLRDVLRDTVVVRGSSAMPARSPLQFTLPEPMAEQLKQAAAGRPEQQRQGG